MRICLYYKNHSSLIFSNKISDEKSRFNTISEQKFWKNLFLIVKADQKNIWLARGPPFVNRWFVAIKKLQSIKCMFLFLFC